MRTAIKNMLTRLATPKQKANVRKVLDFVADYTGRADRDDDGRIQVRTPVKVANPLYRPTTGAKPTDMPVRWRTWDATATPEIHENLTPTQVLPRVVVDVPPSAVDTLVDAYVIRAAVSKLQSTRSVESVVAWLTEYANRPASPVFA